MSKSGHSQSLYETNRKKKRFREFARDGEGNFEGPSFGSRHETVRGYAPKEEELDKSQSNLSQSSTKPPVILAKPGKVNSSNVSNTSDRGAWKEVSTAPTASIAPKVSMTFSRSPQAGSADKKHAFIRSSSESKFRSGASPNLVKQSLNQLSSAPSANLNGAVPIATKGKDIGDTAKSQKMLDSSLHWVESGIDLLLDQNDFMVVGILGMQGVGKSTILSVIAGNCLTDSPKSLLFRQQTQEVKERASHMTSGIDLAVTSERIILLDTQPILSPSLLEQSIQYDRKTAADYSGSTNIEVQSLQLASFLLTVCHVIIVVQDWFTDSYIYKFLQTAEMLKPVTTPPSHDNPSVSERDPADIQPVIVFVHNKIDSDLFNIRSITSMNEVMENMMNFSSVHCKGYFSMAETNLYPGLSSLCPVSHEVNAFLLPDLNDISSEEEKCDVTKVTYDAADQQFLSLPEYVGRPSTALLETTFRKMFLSIPRHQLTHLPLNEKNWFHYAARTWETIRKSQLVSEYNRLLSG